VAGHHARKEELERDALVQLKVLCRDDDAHAPGTENPFDTVLTGEHVARSNGSC
jgi:hypothetical protein